MARNEPTHRGLSYSLLYALAVDDQLVVFVLHSVEIHPDATVRRESSLVVSELSIYYGQNSFVIATLPHSAPGCPMARMTTTAGCRTRMSMLGQIDVRTKRDRRGASESNAPKAGDLPRPRRHSR